LTSGPRAAIAVIVFEAIALALLMWLAMGLASCATQPVAETDYLDRGIASCNIVPSDGVHPCIIELETSDERVLGRIRSLTGCMVRTRQILRQPAFDVF
jgi:hypothetical protein